MTLWIMQYRTRLFNGDWSEWKDLPSKLLFSYLYLPNEFEFRAIFMDSERAFVFNDKLS